MYRSLGWSRADCAKFLHVTERSLHNWESGRHAIPFAAYRLMRIHCGYRLPGRAWDGWSISAGKLWTPEGYGLKPSDAAWWSMLVRRAEVGSQALKQLHEAKRLADAGDVCTASAVRAAAAVAGAPEGAPLAGKDPVRRAAPARAIDCCPSVPFGFRVGATLDLPKYQIGIPTPLSPMVITGRTIPKTIPTRIDGGQA